VKIRRGFGHDQVHISEIEIRPTADGPIIWAAVVR